MQQEYENNKFKELWFNVNKTYYGIKIVQPVLTHWEYVGLSSSMYVKKWQGFCKLAEEIKNVLFDT